MSLDYHGKIIQKLVKTHYLNNQNSMNVFEPLRVLFF